MSFKKGKTWGAGLLLSIALLSSCKSLKNTNTLFLSEYDKFADTAKSVYVANETSTFSNSEYKIKPHDQIAIRNLQNPEGPVSSSTAEGVQEAAIFRLDNEGTVTLPVIGNISLDGLTQREAANKVQSLYAKSLFKDPIIELTIVDYQVTLLGESFKPGNYRLERENIDLIDLIGRSGGFSPYADPSRIKIIRGDRQNPEVIIVNLKQIKSLASSKLILRNKDIIYVPSRGLFNISEGIKSYSAIIQPAFLIVNGLLLIYSLGK